MYFRIVNFSELKEKLIEWRKKGYIPIEININYVATYPNSMSMWFVPIHGNDDTTLENNYA